MYSHIYDMCMKCMYTHTHIYTYMYVNIHMSIHIKSMLYNQYDV